MGAKPFFIVSSGRSGTAMLHKALASLPAVTMEHEYMVHLVQPLAVRRYLGLSTSAEAMEILRQAHGAAIHYCGTSQWGDSSNKLSWLIPELAELFPEARFVHLVRDGRKVAGSYFRKLGAECYDDRSTAILQAFYDHPASNPAPPPEKKYWWPLPRKTDPGAESFRHFGQFERIAWHWAEINRVILDGLSALPDARKHFVRLEELRAAPAALQALLHFLNLPYTDEQFALFQRPHNVNVPKDSLLDSRQNEQFERLGGPMMARLGYAGQPEYVVKY